jgi:CPA1 family monovalent cation:H+ antiporter
MDPFALLSLTIVTAAVLAWMNHRWVRLPTTIGVMAIALAMSMGLFVLDKLGLHLHESVRAVVSELDLGHSLLDVMLAFLLFAGALHVKLEDLAGQRWAITLLATVGVLVTTVLVGTLIFGLCGLLGLEVSFLGCLIFGALIAPTDPIAVMAILKSAGAPRSLETKIAGESLFNDGVGVVVFLGLLSVLGAGHGEAVDGGAIATLLVQEVGGSLLLGLVCGGIAYWMMKTIDSYQVEVLITLALCMGLYSLAAALHTSGPLAVVVAGLLIGNEARQHAMSEIVREHVDTFWELVDEILNVVLFVLIGMEVLILELRPAFLVVGLCAIPLVLLARFLSVAGTIEFLRRRRPFSPHTVKILTWGGLRGGISIALALVLPDSLPERDLFLTVTYLVVIFSIGVQGLTIGPVVRRLLRR